MTNLSLDSTLGHEGTVSLGAYRERPRTNALNRPSMVPAHGKLGRYIAALAVLFLTLGTPALLRSADVNILVIGSTHTYSEGGESGVVQQKAFNPTTIATQLKSIMANDSNISGNVNVVFEDIYKSKAMTVNYSPTWSTNITNHCYSLAQYYMWPDGKDARLANLRGAGGTAWNYVIIMADPYLMANMSGVYSEGVALLAKEINSGTAEPILMAQWPENGSIFTANNFNEVVYRTGNSAGLRVVPAGKAWVGSSSQDTSTSHPTPNGAYLAAAAIYSKLYNRSAKTSSYIYKNISTTTSIADQTLAVVQANATASQYSGTYSGINPFQMKYVSLRTISFNETGTSTEDNIRAALGRVDDVYRVTLNAYSGYSEFNYGRGGDWWEDTKDYDPSKGKRSYGFPMHHFGKGTAPVTMPYGIDKQYWSSGAYDDGTDLGTAYNMIRPGTRELGLPDGKDVRTIPIRLMWLKMCQFAPGLNPLNDNEHMNYRLNDASASFMYTLLSGRCPVEAEPSPQGSDAWLYWLGRKIGYETAWQMSHLTTRSPGFRVLPSATSKTTIDPSSPETMTVRFMYPPQSNVTVNVTNSNSSVATVSPAQLTFTPTNFSTPQSITVTALSGLPANTNFNVVFSTVSADETYNALNDSWSYTALNNLPLVNWSVSSQSSTAESGTMTVTAQLAAPSSQTITVPFTLSGTATLGVDYTITASPVTIPAGSTTGSATITITSDALHEIGGETVILTMGTPTNAGLGATLVHTATIRDDDNTAPVVNAGPDQTVALSSPSVPRWGFAPWTGDADSGISSGSTYTAAHSFGNNRTSAVVNGVTFTEGFVTSGTGWSIGGPVVAWDGNDDAAITGNSELLAQEFYYDNTTPRTVTFTGLIIGQAYEANFYSVGWESTSRILSCSTAGSATVDINQNYYGINNGIRICCVYTATATSHTFTVGSAIHLYAIANKTTPSATVSLDGTATDANSDPLTTTWTLVSGPAGVSIGSPSSVDTTAIFTVAGTYTLRLTANDGYGPVSDDVVITVSSGSGTPTVAWTSAGQASTNESGTMTVTAQLSATSSQIVSVPFTVTGSSSAADRTISASPITIAAGATTGTATITITADTLDEANETVILTIGTPTNAALGATTIHTATITDDDAAVGLVNGSFELPVLPSNGYQYAPAGASWAFSGAGIARNGSPWYVPVAPDGAQGAFIQNSGSSVSQAVNMSAGSYRVSFSAVGRNTFGSMPLNVTIDGTNVLSLTTAQISTAAWTTYTTNVFTVSAGSHTLAFVNGTLAGDHASVIDKVNLVSVSTVAWTTASQTSINESGTLTVTAQLSAVSSQSVSVPFTITGTATSGSDFTVTASPIVIAAGATTGTATITITADTLDEPNETVILTMGVPTNATLGATTVHTATITDDDNSAPAVNAGPDQAVAFSGIAETLGWNYAPWTGDANSGISSGYLYTAKHSFGNNRTSSTVNGVTFTEGNVTSGTGWNIGGTTNFWDGNDDAAVTGNSELLAQEFVYNANPRTVTFSGLTVGKTYEAVLYSAAWETGSRTQVFSTPGVTSSTINQDQYGNNNGIRIACVYTASATTQTLTITPQTASTFHLYAMANREVLPTVATVSLDGTVSDPNGDTLTTTWSVVSGPAPVTIGNASAVDTTATFNVAGVYTLRLTANDGFGPVSDDVVITISSGAGAALTTGGQTSTNESGTLTVTAQLSAGSTLSGTAAAGATIHIYDQGILIGTVVADESGNWTWTASPSLGTGVHHITVTATNMDTAGNISSASTATTVTVAGGSTPAPTASSDSGGKCGLGSGLSAFLLMALTVMARFRRRGNGN